MRTHDARPIIDTACALGEGPVWAHGALAFVDIESRDVHLATLERVRASARMAGRVGAILPRADGGWIACVQGVGLVALDAELRAGAVIADPAPAREDVRYNDGAIDPRGRLWIGTMSLANEPTGALYRVDADGRAHTVLEGLTVSNGIGWSPDGRTMYHVDSPTRRVDAYGFDLESGAITNRRTLASLDDGYPDGLCVDGDGGVWVTRWAGGRVTRFDPENGEATDDVRVPCDHATSCCFAGDDLATLVITTARHSVSDDRLRETPKAGAVFGVRTGRVGQAQPLFAG
jgi:sugar lactone lactonase YvrE